MNPSPVTISVITVALNAAATIRDCLESVNRQTHSPEHIIVDGGSVDGTVQAARAYAAQGAVILSEPDRGIYDAMNKGLALAKGDAVGTLNADDLYPHRDVLAKVASVFEDPDVDSCYGDLVYVDRANLSRVIRHWKASPFDRRLFYRGWMPPHPTFFVRRAVCEQYGGYRLTLGSAADYELMLRYLLKNAVRAQYIPEVLVIMRTGGVSKMNLRNRLRANRKDRMAWTVNGLRPRPWTLIAKPLTKAGQFFKTSVQWQPDANREPPSPVGGNGSVLAGKDYAYLLSGEKLPALYTVTVNFHSERQVQRLIDSLASVRSLKKLIIVDHSSSEALDSLRASFPIQVIRQLNRGYGAGLNRGLKEIPEADSVALLCNPDITIVNPEAITDLLAHLRDHPEAGCLAPALVNSDLKPIPSWRKFYTLQTLLASRVPWWRERPPRFLTDHFYMHEGRESPFDVDWVSGSAMFVRTSLFPARVSFDENFFLYFEDVDLCTQMWLEGLAVRCFPKLVCCHYEQKQSHRELRFFVQHVSSLLKYIVKYWGLPRRESLLAAP
ncbi:MAG: glycosyltransferase [Desulfomonile sp.]|nr:glycosyltransferase [Desulfomonile sp.]